jgi:AcrR family transcriptional regulator
MTDMPIAQIDPFDAPAFSGLELPVAGEAPAERCDAVRNRRRILETAQRLFASEGVDGVSLDRIAAEAGVGKGTVFRRFGDRSGLLHALLSERESAFQESCIRGPAPLGPSAGPIDRLIAFGCEMFAMLETHGDLMRGANASRPGTFARQASPPYMFWRAHVMVLLAAGAPHVEADWAADALLAMLAPDLYLYQRDVRGLSRAQQEAGWRQMVLNITGNANASG